MANYLCGRHNKAVIMEAEISKYFSNLSSNVSPDLVQGWSTEIEEVEAQRYENVKVMDIYVPTSQTPASSSSVRTFERSGSDVYAWLEFALTVKEHQYV